MPSMTPATGTALILLVAFVLPGFVVVLFQERTFKQAEDLTPFDRLLRTVYYGVWCYLLLAAVALIFGVDRASIEHLYHRYRDDPAQLVWRGALAVMAPATFVWLWTLLLHETGLSRRAMERAHLNARHQEPTAWDHWFRKGLKSHLRIVYRDGRSVWGFYGEDSFASYAKDGRDLFLEHIYPERTVVDEEHSEDAAGPWFGTAHESNRGGWVGLDGAVCVEIYDFKDAQSSAPTSPETSRWPWRRNGEGRRAPTDQPSSSEPSKNAGATTAAKEGLNEP
jgi:uncharacterized protein DUF6338